MPGILNRFLPSNFGAQRCPDCDESLKAVDINIQEGVALCPACGKLSRLSSLNTSSRSIAEILDKPPSGCSLTSYGHGAVASVSLRSFAGFLFPAGFALFWNGITSVFVLIAIAGLGSMLNEEQMQWLRAVLREILLQQTIHSRQKSSLPVLPWLSRAQEHRNPTR